MARSEEARSVCGALAEPFDPSELKYKPQVVNGDRAIAVAYIDARLVQDRLDEVVGPENWEDDYEQLPSGCVHCRLRVRIDGEWVVKQDAGSPSEQPDEGDRTKASFSDALKRAAVKFGIGRYLYKLPVAWCDYNPKKRRIVSPPKLPAFALPKRKGQHGGQQGQGERRQEPRPEPEAGRQPRGKSDLPRTGEELLDRLEAYEAKMGEKGLCAEGELCGHVVRRGVEAGLPDDPATWAGGSIARAVDWAKEFCRDRAANPPKAEPEPEPDPGPEVPEEPPESSRPKNYRELRVRLSEAAQGFGVPDGAMVNWVWHKLRSAGVDCDDLDQPVDFEVHREAYRLVHAGLSGGDVWGYVKKYRERRHEPEASAESMRKLGEAWRRCDPEGVDTRALAEDLANECYPCRPPEGDPHHRLRESEAEKALALIQQRLDEVPAAA